jgi:DNA polymerase-3 subunit delta
LKIPARHLTRHLDKGLAVVYLMAGDAPVLDDEALEDVRAAARRAGFDGRELHVTDRSFRWAELESDADNLSLFANRKVVEIRMPAPRPGDLGSRTLAALAARSDRDRLLVVVAGEKLDSAATRTAWVKSIDEHGVLVEVWPVERGELPRWLQRRASAQRLRLDDAAAQLLAERTEGNLLAADQEIRRLAIAHAGAMVGEAEVLESVASNARFDVFRLADAVLAPEAPRAFRVLDSLRAEGVAPVLAAWALVRDVSLLARLKRAERHGESLDGVMLRNGVWKRRQPLVRQALKRFARTELDALVRHAAEVDAAVKGAGPVPAWEALTNLVLAMLRPQGRA